MSSDGGLGPIDLGEPDPDAATPLSPEADVEPDAETVDAGSEPDGAVEPDAGPEPAAGPEPDAGPAGADQGRTPGPAHSDPVLPHRAWEDDDRAWGGSKGADSDDERYLRDVPPHWS